MELKQTEFTQKTKINGPNGEEIRDLMARFQKAYMLRNVDEIMSFYAPEIVAYDIMPPLQCKGTTDYRKSWQAFADNTMPGVKYEIEDLNINASGDLGTAFCVVHMSGTSKEGEKIDVWLRYTGIFSKINGQWKIIHEQSSVPIDMKTDKAIWDLDPHKGLTH